MRFAFDSKIASHFDVEIQLIKESVAARVRLPAEDLPLLFEGAEMDNKMILNDVKSSQGNTITATQHHCPPPILPGLWDTATPVDSRTARPAE
jgi:hypothetical protein